MTNGARRARLRASFAAALAGVVGLAPSLAAQAAPIPFDATECHVAALGTAQPQAPWHLERLQMEQVWHVATGRGVTVAVIDTGVATATSPYLQGAVDKRFTTYDMLDGVKSQGGQQVEEFDCLHGTRVTALLAAGRSEDGGPVDTRVQFAGIAPDARVLTYRVLMQSEADENSEPQPLQPTIDAVLDAVERGVDVINLSQVVPGNVKGIEAFQQAIELAISRGIVVVAASGNTGQLGTGRAYPAAFEPVIAVGATNRYDAPDPVSQYGAKVDVGAPGAGVITLEPSRYDATRGMESQVYSQPVSGTSYAAPIVSGVVALLIQQRRDAGLAPLSPEQIRQRLMDTADPPTGAGHDPRIGAGIVNPLRLLSGEVPQRFPNAGAETQRPQAQYPPAPPVDGRPALVGIAVGIVALLLTVGGIVAAIVIPAARRASGGGRLPGGEGPAGE